MTNLILRPRQLQDLESVRGVFRKTRSCLWQSPTGSGKSTSAAFMLAEAAARGHHAWFLTHRRELVVQAMKLFNRQQIGYGVIAAGITPNKYEMIQIASVQTVVRRLEKITPPKFIVFDEAHHLPSGSHSAIYEAYPDAFKLGLTATPQRLDNKPLREFFDDMVLGPSVRELISDGHLSDFVIYAPPSHFDLSEVHSRAGDYATEELTKVMDKPHLVGDAVDHYLKICPGKRAVVFCVSVIHSQHVASKFISAGVSAVHVDGTTSISERDAAFAAFAKGDIKVLSQVELCGEGVDIPAIEAVILLRPTRSLTLYLQAVGRALRPFAGKARAIILDLAGCSYEHGLPDDDREWSLDSKPKKKKSASESAPTWRNCPKCYARHRPAPKCPECGHVYVGGGREVEHVDGELHEIDREQMRRQMRQEQGKAQTLEQLLAIAKARGRKAGWAHHVWRARQQKMGRKA